jgi:hypothetical protein
MIRKYFVYLFCLLCVGIFTLHTSYTLLRMPPWGYKHPPSESLKVWNCFILKGGFMPYSPPNRNAYNALIQYPDWVRELTLSLDGISWSTGVVSDYRKRGIAVNVDIYSYCEEQRLAVVQVRQCVFHPNRYNEVRKNYYLVGWNENGNSFAHPIDSPARSRKAMATVDGGVRWALCRIWDCDDDELQWVVRNGDVAFVPDRLPKDAVQVEETPIFREHHVLKAQAVFKSGRTYYVKGQASISHTKRQHPPARVKHGVHRVAVGKQFAEWDFSAATID